MPPKIGLDGLPKTRKPRAPKERPPGWTNARWAADVDRRAVETRGRVDRETKSAARKAAAAAAAAADEQARQISMALNPRVFPGSSSIQGTGTFSPSSPAFYMENHAHTTTPLSRFTPSPPEHEDISPALRRGPLHFSTPGNVAGPSARGMPPPGDDVMDEMITEGSMAAASSPGFFTQMEARAAASVASRGASMEAGGYHQDWEHDAHSQPVDGEEEDRKSVV